MFRQKLCLSLGNEVIDAGQDRFSSRGRQPGKGLQPHAYCLVT